MAKNYVYRMHHDTGFAPHIEGSQCFLSGCKCSKTNNRRNIEEAATQESWIIGIGGNQTRQPNKIIYIMQVKANISREQFRSEYPKQSQYISTDHVGTRVLVSDNYYYFGDKAIEVPKGLEHLIVSRQGCKLVIDKDITELLSYLKANNLNPGKHGNPNDPSYDNRPKAPNKGKTECA